MIFYLTLIFIIICGTIILKNNKFKRILLVFPFLILFFISAFRDTSIGNDTNTYINLFNSINIDNLRIYLESYYENGYVILNLIIKLFVNTEQWILIITSFLILILIFIFIKNNSNNYICSIYLFITLLFYTDSMNIIRQYLSMGIVLYCIRYIKNRNFIKFSIGIILSCLFHKSAMVMLPIYFLYGFKFTKKRALVISMIGIVSFVLLPRIITSIITFMNLYEGYVNRIGSNNLANIFNFFVGLCILILGLFYRDKNQDINIYDKNIMEDFTTYIILFSVILNFISIRMNILGRLSSYFDIFYIVYIPNVISNIKNRWQKIIITYIIYIFCLIYFIAIITLRPEWNNLIPYKFFF